MKLQISVTAVTFFLVAAAFGQIGRTDKLVPIAQVQSDQYHPQPKPVIDVRDLPGIDCTGARASDAALNSLTNKARSQNSKTISFRGCPLIRLQNQWYIHSQEHIEIDLGNTINTFGSAGAQGNSIIFGCGGSSGAVVKLDASGYVNIHGGAIVAQGSSCSSNFTESLEANPGSGFTMTNLNIKDIFLASSLNGARITGYTGLYLNGAPNMEGATFTNVHINCQNSPGSYGFRQSDPNADSTTFQGRGAINACFQGLRVESGRVRVYTYDLSGNGGYRTFGNTSGGGTIYEGNDGCVTLLEEVVVAELSGPLLIGGNGGGSNGGNDGACGPGGRVYRNIQASPADPDPAVYHVNLVNGVLILDNVYFTGGTQPAIRNNTLVGSDVNGSAGPNAQLIVRGPVGHGSYQLTNQLWQQPSVMLDEQSGGDGVIGLAPFAMSPGSSYALYGGWNFRTSTGAVIPGIGINSNGGGAVAVGGNDHVLLGSGTVELSGVGSPWGMRLGYKLTGTGGSASYLVTVYGNDSGGNRTLGAHRLNVTGANSTLSVSNYITINNYYRAPGASSYDVVVRCKDGSLAEVGTGVSLPYNITANPTCPGSYRTPTHDETAGLIVRAPQGLKWYYGTPLMCYSDAGSTNAACPVNSSINLARGKQYQVDGAQISSNNLSDGPFTRVYKASLTTTSGTSDNVNIVGITASSHCSLTATNALAARNFAGTYVSAKTTNQITVTHSGASGMTYDILCTVN
jgi:hypothetical protein